MRGRLTAYAGFQLRDFLSGRAVAIVVVTALAAWAYGATHAFTPAMFVSGDVEAREQLQRAFEFALAVFVVVGGAAAAQGLVSRHRARGWDHVVFTRPLSPVRYYVQGFVVAGLGTTLLAIVGAGVYGVAVRPVSALGIAAYVGLAWVMVGGLALMLSTVTSAHVAVLGALVTADLGLERHLNAVHAAGGGNVVLETLQYALPPVHVVVALAEPFARGALVDPRAVAWPVGVGVACLVLAIVLLRRRPVQP